MSPCKDETPGILRTMQILGIETSCDETAAAVVKDGREVVSSVVSSSLAATQRYGGVVPEVAARKQAEYMVPVLRQALGDISPSEIDAVAVTQGPGLIGSLLVGVAAAQSLSYAWQKPLIPVNHLLAHLYAPLVSGGVFTFPVLGLVVSGGHTLLVLLRSHTNIELVSETRDDAAGECFDKCARVLGFPYPGGPDIAQLASTLSGTSSLSLPQPLASEDTLDFSFSGLKTAFLRAHGEGRTAGELAYALQEAIVAVLARKTERALQQTGARMIVVGGGVSANARLRDVFEEVFKEHVLFPPPSLSTDNAVVVAARAFYSGSSGSWDNVSADPSLPL